MKHPRLPSTNDYKAISHALAAALPLTMTRTFSGYSITAEVVKTGKDAYVWQQPTIIRVTQHVPGMTIHQFFKSIEEMRCYIG